MKNTITLTAELYNLLTLPMDDQLEEYTRNAYNSIQGQ